MKHLLKNSLLLFVLLLCLNSCAVTTKEFDSQSTESKKETVKYQEYFDYEKENHPTEKQIMSVKSGMTLSEVIEIIGKPHKFGPTSGITSLEWEADNGKTYIAMVMLPDEMKDIPATVDNMLTYGVIIDTPNIME